MLRQDPDSRREKPSMFPPPLSYRFQGKDPILLILEMGKGPRDSYHTEPTVRRTQQAVKVGFSVYQQSQLLAQDIQQANPFRVCSISDKDVELPMPISVHSHIFGLNKIPSFHQPFPQFTAPSELHVNMLPLSNSGPLGTKPLLPSSNAFLKYTHLEFPNYAILLRGPFPNGIVRDTGSESLHDIHRQAFCIQLVVPAADRDPAEE